jgi:hypothetical protein
MEENRPALHDAASAAFGGVAALVTAGLLFGWQGSVLLFVGQALVFGLLVGGGAYAFRRYRG